MDDAHLARLLERSRGAEGDFIPLDEALLNLAALEADDELEMERRTVRLRERLHLLRDAESGQG